MQLRYLLSKTKEKAALLLKEGYHARSSSTQIVRRVQDDSAADLLWGPGADELVSIAPIVNNAPDPTLDWRVGVHSIPGCQLWGKSNVVLLGKYATPVDQNGNILAYAVLPESYQHFLLHVSFDALYHAGRRQGPAVSRHLPVAVNLVNAWSRSYFHWFVEILPRLMLLHHQAQFWDQMVLVVNSAPTAWQRRSLALLNFPVDRVVLADEGPYQVEQLLIPAHVHQRPQRMGLFVPSLLDRLRSQMLDNLPQEKQPPSSSGNIYISRRRANGRQLANEQALLQSLTQYGFDAYCLEDLTLDEQMWLFRGAKQIIAPHGAGLTNMLWAERATVIELRGLYWNPSYWMLANTLNHRYLCYQADANDPRLSQPEGWSKRGDFTIDIDRFVTFLTAYA